MVVLNDSLQIIEHSMEEEIVVRNRGGGCIVKHSPLFSPNGKYIYVVSGNCVSAFSAQTGECTHQFTSKSKENIVSAAIYRQNLITATGKGNISVWNVNSNSLENTVKLSLNNTTVVEIHPVKNANKDDSFDIVVAAKEVDKKDLQLLQYSALSGKLIANLYVRAEAKAHTVSVAGDTVAAIKHDRLTCVQLTNTNNKSSVVAGGGRWWTVVQMGPDGRGVAAGDNTGRILYWPQTEQTQTKATFHWHTLAVSAITFSPSGSYMFSGGGEGVMVRWNLEVSNMRNFLPRLPAPILHLSVSPDNQHVAIATQDNGIQVTDTQNRVSCVIQKVSWGVCPVAGERLFPAGLLWDPRSRSIVLNGRPGHLQFFNTDDNKLLYNLDIVGQNYLTQERHKEIINTEVTHVAMSPDGKWMVTVETRDDQQTFLESLLKFWQYKFNARQFSLNSCIQLPHQGKVNSVRFQPAGHVPDQYLLVTTGSDCKFRLWTPAVSQSVHNEGMRWVCESVGYFRSLPAECVSFSADGSVLGVSFGPSLTLWDSETCQLNTSLTRDHEKLIAVEFGTGNCCHLVVTANTCHLSVWSILTLFVVWTVPVNTTVLCADPFTSNMAVFTADNSVFVFSPLNAKPLYEKRNVCPAESQVLAAIFVPRPQTLLDTNAPWCSVSQLHFIDNNQELQYLELESERDPGRLELRGVTAHTPSTPFSVLAAKQSNSSVLKTEGSLHDQFGTKAEAAVRELLSYPAHTTPPVHMLCQSFLKSLAISRKTDGQPEENEDEENMKMEIDEDSDSDKSVKVEEAKVSEVIDKSAEVSDKSVSVEKTAVAGKKKRRHKSKKKNKTIENNSEETPKKELKETPSKKKQKRKANKDKKSQKKRENSFTIDDLDMDWLSVLENR